jgi:hypothetical protein
MHVPNCNCKNTPRLDGHKNHTFLDSSGLSLFAMDHFIFKARKVHLKISAWKRIGGIASIMYST